LWDVLFIVLLQFSGELYLLHGYVGDSFGSGVYWGVSKLHGGYDFAPCTVHGVPVGGGAAIVSFSFRFGSFQGCFCDGSEWFGVFRISNGGFAGFGAELEFLCGLGVSVV
jgi:hypothetical protein